MIKPNFKFQLSDYNPECTQRLLDDLYTENASNNNNFKLDDVISNESVDKQIKAELESVIRVKSIFKMENNNKQLMANVNEKS